MTNNYIMLVIIWYYQHYKSTLTIQSKCKQQINDNCVIPIDHHWNISIFFRWMTDILHISEVWLSIPFVSYPGAVTTQLLLSGLNIWSSYGILNPQHFYNCDWSYPRQSYLACNIQHNFFDKCFQNNNIHQCGSYEIRTNKSACRL